MNLLTDLWILFALFFRIGLVSIGGGYVMLPVLRQELVAKRKWISDNEMLNYYAIGQATPGIIAINTATFVGYKKRGIPGAVSATVGMVAPSLIIISLIAAFIPLMQENLYFQKVFKGIRVSVAALLAGTLVSLLKKSNKSLWDYALSLAAFMCVILLKISPVLIISGAVLIGLLKGRKNGIS